jgi:hypothetical protein
MALESLKGKRCCRQVKFYSGVSPLTSRWSCLSRILARQLNPAVLHPSRSNCRIRLAGLRRRLAVNSQKAFVRCDAGWGFLQNQGTLRSEDEHCHRGAAALTRNELAFDDFLGFLRARRQIGQSRTSVPAHITENISKRDSGCQELSLQLLRPARCASQSPPSTADAGRSSALDGPPGLPKVCRRYPGRLQLIA